MLLSVEANCTLILTGSRQIHKKMSIIHNF